MQEAERRLLGLVAHAAWIEATASDGQLISHAVDRMLVLHPWLTRVVIILTALHLLNALDYPVLRWLDPYQWIGRAS